MVSVTLSVPEEIREKMDKFKWLNWSAVAREAFLKRINQLEILNKFENDFEKSKLSDKDCLELGRKLKESMIEKSKESKR